MKVKLLKVIQVHFQEGGVDVDGPGSEAAVTGEADRGLRYCIILSALPVFVSEHTFPCKA
jgi:hypothetical protein